jgi:hypothetical protein
MEDPNIYFQLDFKGEETTSTGEFQEGYSSRTIIVEVGSNAYGGRLENRSADEAAQDLAQSVASELARQELADLGNNASTITRLDEFPPVLQDVEPDTDESGVRAWLLK